MTTLPENQTIRVGIAGTGFIARRLMDSCRLVGDLRVAAVLTHRPLESVKLDEEGARLVDSTQELVDSSDIIVECSGNPLHAAEVVRDALAAGLRVVTMNSEFHVTCGSHFVGEGYLTEASGDQPGVQALLREELIGMGFKPLVYGNMKGYLNLDPSPADMTLWSEKQGFRMHQTTSFTDGTKVQIEQAFTANAFGAGIARPGLISPTGKTFEEAAGVLSDTADTLGYPIADFTVVPGQPPGVFIIATIDPCQRPVLAALKMGNGPYYTFIRPYHLCALEIPNTIRAAMRSRPPLLNNSAFPTIGVAAIAKRTLSPGERIECGIGSFQVRGSAIRLREEPDHVPIGLLYGATVRRRVGPGEKLTWDHVELPESYARDITFDLLQKAQLPTCTALESSAM